MKTKVNESCFSFILTIFRSANIPFNFMSNLNGDQIYFHWLCNICVADSVSIILYCILQIFFPFTILPWSNGFFNAPFAVWINTGAFHIAHAYGGRTTHTHKMHHHYYLLSVQYISIWKMWLLSVCREEHCIVFSLKCDIFILVLLILFGVSFVLNKTCIIHV